MNTKQKLQNIIDNDASYNKNATRYLYKTDPDLWIQILEDTKFLPNNAKPKQRIWHILNEIYERPKCPTTGNFVKWYENRYLESFDRSSKTTLMNKRGKMKNQTEEAKAKRTATILQNYKEGKVKPIENRIRGKEMTKLVEAAIMEKYGVKNIMELPEFRKKISDKWIESGRASSIEERGDREIYYQRVAFMTELSWKNQFDKINPERINRSVEFHLDHIYSIQQGFIDNIPPYIIGHWTNLRMLPRSENDSKHMKCHKTQEQLFEDFFSKQ